MAIFVFLYSVLLEYSHLANTITGIEDLQTAEFQLKNIAEV